MPVGALPNTTLQVPMPMPGKSEAQAAGSKEKKAQYTLYNEMPVLLCGCHSCSASPVSIAMLALVGHLQIHWGGQFDSSRYDFSKVACHEIPPPEMFSGVDLHGPDHEVVLNLQSSLGHPEA